MSRQFSFIQLRKEPQSSPEAPKTKTTTTNNKNSSICGKKNGNTRIEDEGLTAMRWDIETNF